MVEVLEAARLYVVVDGQMPYANIAPQAMHALTELALADPRAHRKWHDNGNVIVVLAARDGGELEDVLAEAENKGFVGYSFHEPDWVGMKDHTPSAVAFIPDPGLRELLVDLPLAGRHGFLGELMRRRAFRRRF